MVESMGVVSRRWVWVEYMCVASGCGCKEVHVYRFLILLIPIYSSCSICSFLQQHPCLFIKKNVFRYCSSTFL